MSSQYQLDASAVLAVLQEERGAEIVEPMLDAGSIHTFNLAEVVTKLLQKGVPDPEALVALLRLRVEEDFSLRQAMDSARLHAETRRYGLSMGDCVCLTMARWNHATAVTTDNGWVNAVADRNIQVCCIR